MIAVLPRLWGRERIADWWIAKFSDALQLFLDDRGFNDELLLIGEMLVMTSTAFGEVWAARLDPTR
jgi:hypothetical protein